MRYRLNATLLAVIIAVAGCDQNGSFSGGGGGGGGGPGQTRQAQGISLTFPQDWQVNEGGGAVLVGRAPRATAQDRFVQTVNVQLLPRGRKESAPGFIERHEAYAAASLRGYAVNCSAEEGKFDLYKDRFEEVCHSLHVDNAQAGTLGHAGGDSLIPGGG